MFAGSDTIRVRFPAIPEWKVRRKSLRKKEAVGMFRNCLDNMIDMRHELMRLGELVDGKLFEA